MHINSPKIHSSEINLEIVTGMQTNKTNKSATAKLIMNLFVIVCILLFKKMKKITITLLTRPTINITK